jgi:tetratricopeptide (TPR) repeat protein
MSHLERIEELRAAGVAKHRHGHFEDALQLFEQAYALTTDQDEELREILTINKAGALIFMERETLEVQQLHEIVMRRRNATHLYLAAYQLQHKYALAKNHKRAISYGRIALDAAETLGDTARKSQVLILLGNLCVFDSKIAEARAYYDQALELLDDVPENGVRRAFAVQNLGYCMLMMNETAQGVATIHRAVEMMTSAGAESFVSESCIDLCSGYLDLGDFERAREYGELGLSLATEVRQVRNAHYLLGEVAYKSGDMDRAESHFEHLATHYPDFPHLKSLLLAIDLRGLVNFKL